MIPVYVIHLPNAERKEKIAAELARVGFTDITYVHAKEPARDFTCSNMRRNPRGEFGCALSHIKAIAQSIEDDENAVLICEDDIEFSGEPIDPFLFPPYWDIVYWGGHPRGPTEFDNGYYRITKGFSCAEAYVMSRRARVEFLQYWCDRAGQKDAMYDFILGEYAASTGGGYAVYPTLTHQPPGYSQIGQKNDDKRDLIERGWRNNLSTRSA